MQYFILLSLNISKGDFSPLHLLSPFLKLQLLKGTVMLFYFCCFAFWWWWWPQWCVEFIFTAFHEQRHFHLLMYLITAVLLFCIIVLIYSRGLTCYDLLSMCPWDLSVLPYGEIVLHDNLSTTEEFNSEVNMIIVSVQWNPTLSTLSFSPWCQDDCL